MSVVAGLEFTEVFGVSLVDGVADLCVIAQDVIDRDREIDVPYVFRSDQMPVPDEEHARLKNNPLFARALAACPRTCSSNSSLRSSLATAKTTRSASSMRNSVVDSRRRYR